MAAAMRSMRGGATHELRIARRASSTTRGVPNRPAPTVVPSSAMATPSAMPDQKSTGSTRPTSAPASVRVGSTANAAGATTAATSSDAPSHAARSPMLVIESCIARALIA